MTSRHGRLPPAAIATSVVGSYAQPDWPRKRIILGAIDLDDHAVESPETVAARIRRALPYKRPTELVAAPDCGMKYLPRDAAFGKLESLAAGAAIVRGEA